MPGDALDGAKALADRSRIPDLIGERRRYR